MISKAFFLGNLNAQRVILTSFMFVRTLTAFGQLSEADLKTLLYTSVFTDGSTAYSIGWEKLSGILDSSYRSFDYSSSKWYSLYLPGKEGLGYYEYHIRIFRIPSCNSTGQNRYLINYKDISSNVYLRLSGYVENDMQVFFKYLESRSIKKKQLQELVEDWKQLDPIFEDVNLQCILRGYLRNSTKSKCFQAVHFISLNECTIGVTPLHKNELNSVFSRLPLYGFLNLTTKEF